MGTSLDDGSLELDRLFAQVERGPFRGRTTHDVPTELPPGLADSMGFADLWGNLSSGGGGTNSIANGTFAAGPAEDEDAVIDDEGNSLPEWDYVEVAGSWEVTWIDYPNAPDDKAIQFAQASGAPGDEVYFEQTIPIDYYRRLVTTAKHEGSNGGLKLKVAVQFLDTVGATVGSELYVEYNSTALVVSRFWREPPNLATYARIRFGCSNSSGVDGATRTILFITTEEPTTYSVEIPFVYSFLSPLLSNDYTLSHPSDIIPGGVYIADTQGFVLAIKAKTNDTIAAGSGDVIASNDTQAITPGPYVTLSPGVVVGSARASLDGSSAYDFEVDDELSVELEADASWSSTGGADYSASIRLLLVVNDEGDW